MLRFQFKESSRPLTSSAGLALIGQCFEAAGLDSLNARFPTSQGLSTSEIIKTYTALLTWARATSKRS